MATARRAGIDVRMITGDHTVTARAIADELGLGPGVITGSQLAAMTDDNFGTLVHAVDLGRDIYRRISSSVKLQLTVLSSVLQLMLLATVLNINDGVGLFPLQLLFAK